MPFSRLKLRLNNYIFTNPNSNTNPNTNPNPYPNYYPNCVVLHGILFELVMWSKGQFLHLCGKWQQDHFTARQSCGYDEFDN